MKGKIAVVLGSKSDLKRLEEAFSLLDQLNMKYTVDIISAHRNPDKLRLFCKTLEKNGIKVVIACAGLACALPGFIASYASIPVIGVPLEGGVLDGMDSLLSIVQVPKGLGLVSSGMGKRGLLNAFIFSLEILALGDKRIYKELDKLRNKLKS